MEKATNHNDLAVHFSHFLLPKNVSIPILIEVYIIVCNNFIVNLMASGSLIPIRHSTLSILMLRHVLSLHGLTIDWMVAVGVVKNHFGRIVFTKIKTAYATPGCAIGCWLASHQH